MLPRTNPQFLAHLSAIGPDSLFPSWANKWPKEEAASTCASTSSSTRPNSPFVSAFFELRSTALVGRPSLLAIYPKWLKIDEKIIQFLPFLKRIAIHQIFLPNLIWP
jgi:hypothetical protein